ncbi:ECF transporter S component [Caproiciproducens sp. MSJ-32]|uniref:ECF transporter S component n=1 Tax=Caproiciproducens sp. MSJ-32 TaxID=2841527 RepID=UPI001C0FCF95|nr:ECF transporter S component [Caproiciproducens sp. MSJ-32]MBU5455305.1 ECF transporter S component [Caproiciproducens sp. MSJ-32]
MLNERGLGNSREHIRKMVVISMLSGISIFLGLTGLGFIPLPLFKLTILHLPVIIGAIIEGPVVGASIGFIFGLFSIYQNITAPTVMSPFFYNPIVSILPRVFIAITAYYTYNFLKTKLKNLKLSIGIASIIGSLTNTVGVLGSIYLLYFKSYSDILIANGTITSSSRSSVALALLSIVTTNGLAEAILSALICTAVVISVFKMQKRNK